MRSVTRPPVRVSRLGTVSIRRRSVRAVGMERLDGFVELVALGGQLTGFFDVPREILNCS
jgi:hypothetical protein